MKRLMVGILATVLLIGASLAFGAGGDKVTPANASWLWFPVDSQTRTNGDVVTLTRSLTEILTAAGAYPTITCTVSAATDEGVLAFVKIDPDSTNALQIVDSAGSAVLNQAWTASAASREWILLFSTSTNWVEVARSEIGSGNGATSNVTVNIGTTGTNVLSFVNGILQP